jgi:hypothetical protein
MSIPVGKFTVVELAPHELEELASRRVVPLGKLGLDVGGWETDEGTILMGAV